MELQSPKYNDFRVMNVSDYEFKDTIAVFCIEADSSWGKEKKYYLEYELGTISPGEEEIISAKDVNDEVDKYDFDIVFEIDKYIDYIKWSDKHH